MYKLQNKTSMAIAEVTDKEKEIIWNKKLTDDPEDKRTWAFKYKILEHRPDQDEPNVSFNPPELAIPEVLTPLPAPASATVTTESGTKKANDKKSAK